MASVVYCVFRGYRARCFLLPLYFTNRFSSRPLDGLVNELETNYQVMVTLLKQTAEWNDVLPCFIAAKTLRGISCDIDLDDMLRDAVKNDNSIVIASTKISQIELCVIMQDFNSAHKILEGATGNLRDSVPGHFRTVRITSLEALVYLKAAQTAKYWRVRRKLKKKATKLMKLIRSWLKCGNVNIVHVLHLLSAEHAVLKGNKLVAEEQFKLSIAVASQNGFLQDRGIAHELAGKYYISQGDEYWARYHLEKAELSFSDWGAIIKVDQLREQKKVLLGE